MKRWTLFLFTVTCLIPALTHATTFSKVDARGTGCPLGSTDIVTSPDGQTVSLLFNEMLVELPQFDGNNDNDQSIDGHGPVSRFNKNIVQKVCNILVETDLPPDHKVDSIEVKVDFRGSTIMDEGTTAFFHSQLLNLQGPGRSSEARRDFIARKIWREGPEEEDWIITGDRTIKVNGNCSRRGDSKSRFNLRNIVRASIKPLGQSLDSFVFIGLDTADLVGKLQLKVNSSSCRARPDRPTRPTRPTRPIRPVRPGRPVKPGRPGFDRGQKCPPGLIFHDQTRRCLTKREIALRGRW